MLTPASIRQAIRQHRRTLTSQQQQQAAEQICLTASQHPQVITAQHVSLFLSIDGELDTTPLINWLWQQGKLVYVPVIHPFSKGHLLFLRYEPTTILKRGPLGIYQPALDIRNVLPLSRLDVLFVPLVAFDSQGNRLGMGGGYFDRTLQHWQDYHISPIGLAHDCQHIEHLTAQAWDIPLPEIITPSKWWRF